MSERPKPVIIQGGMGAAVSDWRLAKTVSLAGQLGVVSGTALDVILTRRLQMGDPGGHIRRALAAFPLPEISQPVLDHYFVEGGKPSDTPFKSKPMLAQKLSRRMQDLLVLGNFVEVYLAKEGHDGVVGINLLEKIQSPTLPSLYGAMLADVDYVLMGAGIPRAIPGILDQLAKHEPVSMKLDVHGATPDDVFEMTFDPGFYELKSTSNLKRPDFLAIVSFATLANVLAKKASGKVNGFVVEGPTAGGHNAPPRGKLQLTADGQPIYSERDVPDLEAIKKLGLPFWLAGGYAHPSRIVEALAFGAAGVQIGTTFAFCDESGLDAQIKAQTVEMIRQGDATVFTDPKASPTGFPFKVVQLPESLSNADEFENRQRICDLGYLRHGYKKDDGSLGWRCPAEPEKDYVAKGGCHEETQGRKCVCNALMANITLGQTQSSGENEKPLVTAGDDFSTIKHILDQGKVSYNVDDVLTYLLSEMSPKHHLVKKTVTPC
ncbi:MAG TPA: 2-nitropropane dioxygenase [Phycisphaerales bacterium]|nr:2-nitropropane dioxygenase [Phycisphaerales bacterium]HCD32823.1 2-nitropropane dioxygenase [Phycisphaerales bacterium]